MEFQPQLEKSNARNHIVYLYVMVGGICIMLLMLAISLGSARRIQDFDHDLLLQHLTEPTK